MLWSTMIMMLPKKTIRMRESQFSFGILFECYPSFNLFLMNEHNHSQPTLPNTYPETNQPNPLDTFDIDCRHFRSPTEGRALHLQKLRIRDKHTTNNSDMISTILLVL